MSKAKGKVGRTEGSWRKHEFLGRAVAAICATGRVVNKALGIAIDANAGDATGVPTPQADLFGDDNSTTTAGMVAQLTMKYGLHGLLCERNPKCRAALTKRFPWLPVIDDHAAAPAYIAQMKERPRWGVAISDANGPSEIGVEHLAAMGALVPFLDYFIVYPQVGIARCIGNPVTRPGYAWMSSDHLDQWDKPLPSLEWLERLNRKRMATTPVIIGSKGFHYRLLVISNYLPKGITQNPMFFELSTPKKPRIITPSLRVLTNANHLAFPASLAPKESAPRSA